MGNIWNASILKLHTSRKKKNRTVKKLADKKEKFIFQSANKKRVVNFLRFDFNVD